jgi:hypothetical protein
MTYEERDSLRLRSKNMPRVTNAARATIQPIAVPAIVAILLLDEALSLDVGEAPDDVGVTPLKVDEWTDAVDDGELALRHEASLESVTVSRSELPPCLPSESVITNTSSVPALTSAIQLKLEPIGGWSMRNSPPGISACSKISTPL